MIVDNFLYGRTTQPNKMRELKVKIPIAFHMRLHGLKIMGEQSISATVEEALDAYFAKLAEKGNLPAGDPGQAAADVKEPVAHDES